MIQVANRWSRTCIYFLLTSLKVILKMDVNLMQTTPLLQFATQSTLQGVCIQVYRNEVQGNGLLQPCNSTYISSSKKTAATRIAIAIGTLWNPKVEV